MRSSYRIEETLERLRKNFYERIFDARAFDIYIKAQGGFVAQETNSFPLEEKLCDYIHGDEIKSILVLGDPGLGKTLLSYHLADLFWRSLQHLNHSSELSIVLPVWVYLPDLKASNALQNILGTTWMKQGLSNDEINDLKIACQKNQLKILVIIDSLDEIRIPEKNFYIENNWFGEEWPNIKVVTFSRPEAFSTLVIPSNYRRLFYEHNTESPNDSASFKELYVQSFSSKDVDFYLQDFVSKKNLALSKDQEIKITCLTGDPVNTMHPDCIQDLSHYPEIPILIKHQSNQTNKDTWQDWKTYKDTLDRISPLAVLAKNPFVLSIMVQALPNIVEAASQIKDYVYTRERVYAVFVDYWLEKQTRRIWGNSVAREMLLGAGLQDGATLKKCLWTYSENLARCAFNKGGGKLDTLLNQEITLMPELVHHTKSEKPYFHADPVPEGIPEIIRSGCLLKCQGDTYRFLHKTIVEFFAARAMFNGVHHAAENYVISEMELASISNDFNFNEHSLLSEPQIVHLLADIVNTDDKFKQLLYAIVEFSKQEIAINTAAANAFTVLNVAGEVFNDKDYRGIHIAGADMTGAICDGTDFSYADLSGGVLKNVWMHQAKLFHTNLLGVKFGVLPSIKHDKYFTSMAAYPEKSQLFTADRSGQIICWDLITCEKLYSWQASAYRAVVKITELIGFLPIEALTLSPSRKKLAYATFDGAVHVCHLDGSETKTIVSDATKFNTMTNGYEHVCNIYFLDNETKVLFKSSKVINSYNKMSELNNADPTEINLLYLEKDQNGFIHYKILDDNNKVHEDTIKPDELTEVTTDQFSHLNNYDYSSFEKIKKYILKVTAMRSHTPKYGWGVWNIDDGKFAETIIDRNVSECVMSYDGKYFACSTPGNFNVYHFDNLQLVFSGSLEGSIFGFSPQGKWLISGNSNGKVFSLYSTNDWGLIRKVKLKEAGRVFGAVFTPDENYFLHDGDDSISVWEIESGNCLYTFPCVSSTDSHSWMPGSLPILLKWRSSTRAFFQRNHTIFTFDVDTVSLYFDRKVKEFIMVDSVPQGTFDMEINIPNFRVLYEESEHYHHSEYFLDEPYTYFEEKITVKDGTQNDVQFSIISPPHYRGRTHTGKEFFLISPDSCFLAYTRSPSTVVSLVNTFNMQAPEIMDWVEGEMKNGKMPIFIFDLQDKSLKYQLAGHRTEIMAMIFSSDSQWFISARTTVRIWDMANGACIKHFKKVGKWVDAIALTSDKSILAIFDGERNLSLWDVKREILLGEVSQIIRRVKKLHFSVDGKYLECIPKDGKKFIYRLVRAGDQRIILQLVNQKESSSFYCSKALVDHCLVQSQDEVTLLKQLGAVGTPIVQDNAVICKNHKITSSLFNAEESLNHSQAIVEMSYYSLIYSRLPLSYESWTISLLRDTKSHYPEHTFIIIEGVNTWGRLMLYRHEIATQIRGVTIPDDYAKIVTQSFAGLNWTNFCNILIDGLLNANVMGRGLESIVGHTWTVPREKCLQLHHAIMHENKQNNGLVPYSVLGKESFFSWNGHNCYTWCRNHLGSLDLEHIKNDLPQKSVDYIGAYPRVHLDIPPDRRRAPPQSQCLIM